VAVGFSCLGIGGDKPLLFFERLEDLCCLVGEDRQPGAIAFGLAQVDDTGGEVDILPAKVGGFGVAQAAAQHDPDDGVFGARLVCLSLWIPWAVIFKGVHPSLDIFEGGDAGKGAAVGEPLNFERERVAVVSLDHPADEAFEVVDLEVAGAGRIAAFLLVGEDLSLGDLRDGEVAEMGLQVA